MVQKKISLKIFNSKFISNILDKLNKSIINIYSFFRKRLIINLSVQIIIILGTVYSCSGIISENEGKNDSFKYPQEIPIGKSVKGGFHTEDDIDFYAYRIEKKPLFIKGRLDGMKGIDHKLSIYSVDALILEIDGNPAQASEEFAPIIVNSDYIFAKVERSSFDKKNLYPDASYILLIETTEFNLENFEMEFNNDYKNATEIELKDLKDLNLSSKQKLENPKKVEYDYSSSIYGFHNYTASTQKKQNLESDFYLLNIPHNEIFLLDISLKNAPKTNPVLEVFKTDNSNLLLTINQGINNEPEKMENIGVKGPEKYYINVYETKGRMEHTTPYQLNYRLRLWDGKREYEPNDDISEAVELKSLEITGILTSDTDTDYYKLSNEKNKEIFLELILSTPEKVALDIIFFDHKKLKLYQVTKADEDSKFFIPNVIVPPESVLYFNLLFNQDNSDAKLAFKDISYKLEINKPDWKNTIEKEPNNSIKNATDVSKKKKIIGFLTSKKDIDFFYLKKWKIKNNQKIKLSGIEGVVLHLKAYDEKGNFIKEEISPSSGKEILLLSDSEYVYISIDAKEIIKKDKKNKYILSLK
jgi:hypothetical protein